ncbi:MAG: hypothetical protein SFW35_06745 [Chitinophagales bacterium]|nr:hypothetical protein [Chitinophagales bacterium]
MPYNIDQSKVTEIGKGLEEYYNDAWHKGVKGSMDRMAHANMGYVTKFWDVTKDTYANFKKESTDEFMGPFKAEVKLQAALYFANKYDVMMDVAAAAEKAFKFAVSFIPVPGVGPVVKKLGQTVVKEGVSAAVKLGNESLQEKSVKLADSQIAAKTGNDPVTFFASDLDAINAAKRSIESYKLVGKFADTLPANITSFDDAIAFPKATFRVQEAVSQMSIELYRLQIYIQAMQERLGEVNKVSASYIDRVRKEMPNVVSKVIQTAYNEGLEAGRKDIGKNKYAAPPQPALVKPSKPGAATVFGAYVAHAFAQGYYDVGNTGPRFVTNQGANPMARAATPPPVPPRPSGPPNRTPPPLPPKPGKR